jgi:tRNA threonylcarbamoyladenosine biosynthesis protein TsaE
MTEDTGLFLADAAETEAIGAAIAARLRPGDIVALEGALGMGKTTLARGLLAALGFAGEVPSPTFAIVQPYASPDVRLPVWHVDLYRLEDAGETEELGLEEALEEGALLVEWPDRLDAYLLGKALRLSLRRADDGGRRLTWETPASWEGRWPPR